MLLEIFAQDTAIEQVVLDDGFPKILRWETNTQFTVACTALYDTVYVLGCPYSKRGICVYMLLVVSHKWPSSLKLTSQM